MLTRSRIITGASALAGDPPNEPLPTGIPEWLRYETAADLETELMRDLNLSSENRTLARYPVRLNAGEQEFTVNQPGFEKVSYVSMTFTDNPNVVPASVDISNLSLINSEARDGRRVIAFYDDKPQKGIVSWIPSGNEELTIWYDKSPQTDPSADLATFRIADSYVPLLKLLLAAAMLDMLKQPVSNFLALRITRGMKQWEKHVTQSGQPGIVQKHAWRPGRYGGTANQWDAGPAKVRFE